jgi:methylenetetrahydrofolate reductase (NADPH)
VKAGAQFAITQMVFDADAYGRFLDRCERAGLDVPVVPGTRILRSRVQATQTAVRFGVTVPAPVRAALPAALKDADDPDATERGIAQFLQLVERLRALGAPGIHVFVTHTPSACAALAGLASRGGCRPGPVGTR